MSTKGKILIVDSDSDSLTGLEHSIKGLGFDCIGAGSSEEALQDVERYKPSMVIADLFLKGQDGISTLKEIRRFDPGIILVLLTSNGHVSSATEAIRFGAFDYLQKPVSNERLKSTILRAFNYKYSDVQKNLLMYEKLEGAIRKFMVDKQGDDDSRARQKNNQPPRAVNNIIGQSAVMRDLFEKVVKISNSNANVMVYGESGTGKELIVRSVHANSARHSHALIPVDCVALPENLLESELFGYEKGAFTGAESLRRGLFEYAHKGTLFLDEITELAPNLQAKLLRVLQEGEFRRVGGKHLVKIDLRIVSATNIKPLDAIASGKLREDLYYRLNVIPLEIPPLRQRQEDIPYLISHFLEKFSKAGGKKKTVHPDVIEALQEYAWPGNVRELQNLIEHLVSLIEAPTIRLSDLPDNMRSSSNGRSLLGQNSELPFLEARKRVIQEFESEYLLNLIKKCNGNISKAAQEAAISRRTMYRLINMYNLHKHSTSS